MTGGGADMHHILVLYDSVSGNTRKMAEHVARGAKLTADTAVRCLSIDQASPEDVLWCHGAAVGTPTHTGVLSWKMKKFWDEDMHHLWGRLDGKIGCAFSSSGGWGGGAELACLSVLTVLMNFGFLVFGVTDYVDEQFTLHYGAVAAGEPAGSREIAACERLGRTLALRVAKISQEGPEKQPRNSLDAGGKP